MSVRIITTEGEDLTNGEGYFVSLAEMSAFVQQMAEQGFIVMM